MWFSLHVHAIIMFPFIWKSCKLWTIVEIRVYFKAHNGVCIYACMFLCDLCVYKLYTNVHSVIQRLNSLFFILKGYSSETLPKGREEQIDSLFLDIYFPAEMSYSLCTCSMYKSTAVSLSETSSWQLSIINMQTLVEVKIIINYLSPPYRPHIFYRINMSVVLNLSMWSEASVGLLGLWTLFDKE